LVKSEWAIVVDGERLLCLIQNYGARFAPTDFVASVTLEEKMSII
jgi:hypothetical protein